MQVMMTKSNPIKVKLFSGKQKYYPKWALKPRSALIMCNLEHAIKEYFLGKLKENEGAKVEPTEENHTP